MLGKLLKYEFKASSKLFLIMYAAILVVALLNVATAPMTQFIDNGGAGGVVIAIIKGVVMMGYVLLMIGTPILTIVIIISRFYKNLMGDEGYLMFTLPVSADQHILSKFIAALVWSVVSAAVMFISLIISVMRLDLGEMFQTVINAANEAGINLPLVVICVLITVLIYFTTSIMMFYTAMAIGPNLTKNRLLGSFLAYLIVYAAVQVVSLISIFGVGYAGLFKQIEYANTVTMTTETVFNEVSSLFTTMFFYVNILNLITIVGCYIVTRYFVKNKLNLS